MDNNTTQPQRLVVNGLEYALVPPKGKKGRPREANKQRTKILFNIPAELKQKAQQKAREQYVSLSAFIIQAIAIRVKRT